MKKTGLSSAAEDNKRECTISHQDSALFTFKTMEGEKSFFRRIVALYLKAGKKKKKNNKKNPPWTCNTGAWSYKKRTTKMEVG